MCFYYEAGHEDQVMAHFLGLPGHEDFIMARSHKFPGHDHYLMARFQANLLFLPLSIVVKPTFYFFQALDTEVW